MLGDMNYLRLFLMSMIISRLPHPCYFLSVVPGLLSPHKIVPGHSNEGVPGPNFLNVSVHRSYNVFALREVRAGHI